MDAAAQHPGEQSPRGPWRRPPHALPTQSSHQRRSPLNGFIERLTDHSILTENERAAILALPGHSVEIQSNRDFVRLGERVDHASLVVSGLIGRFSQTAEGHRQITALHIKGDLAGLQLAVAPESPAAFQALAVTTLFKIPHASLRDVARHHPAIAEAFWRESVADAAVLAEWMMNVGRRNALKAAAHFLCEMAFRYQAVGDYKGGGYPFPVTQSHLGDILALTPVHVNRTLQALRNDCLVDVRHKAVRILDWPRLAAVGEFDSSYLQMRTFAGTSPILQPVAATPA